MSRIQTALERARAAMLAIRGDDTSPAPAPNARKGDGWYNAYSGLGSSSYDASRQTTYVGSYDLTSRPQIIRELMRSNPIGRKVVEKQVLLAWGSGVEWSATNRAGDDVGEQFKSARQRLELERKIQRARTLGRAFGGALLIMSVDDGLDPSDPLDLSRVRRLLYLRPIDRWDVSRLELDVSGGVRDGEVEFYTITTTGQSSVRLHHSRVIRFNGLEVDRYTRGTLGGWDDSVLQPAYDAIRDIDSGRQSLSTQLQSAVQTVYHIKGLHEQILAGNKEFVEDWIGSVELFRSNMRAIGLDADNERISFEGRPLGDAVTVFYSLMHTCAAAADMPLTELFGMSPSGLSTDDLSGTRRYYDKIESEEQRGEQGRALDVLLEVIASQSQVPELYGATLSYEWPSLYSPTALERAQLTRTQADTLTMLIGAGVLSPADVRETGAQLVGVELAPVEPELESDPGAPSATPTDLITDPVERMQQARLAIQSGVLHLPDTAPAFRPLLGLEPLKPGDTESWLSMVKTSTGSPGAPPTPGAAPPAPVGTDSTDSRADATSPAILARMTSQASRLASGQEPIPYASVKPYVARSLKGLPALEVQGLSDYIEGQWGELAQDVRDFAKNRGEEDASEIKALARTRARLRGVQIERMIKQARVRADMATDGHTLFVWHTQRDDSVRPEHKALEGQSFPLSAGHPEQGFPGDAHGCRCKASSPAQSATQKGARGDDDKTTPARDVHLSYKSTASGVDSSKAVKTTQGVD